MVYIWYAVLHPTPVFVQGTFTPQAHAHVGRTDGLPIRGKRNSRRDAFRGWANPSYIQGLFIVVLSLKSRFIRLQLQVLNESFRYDLMQRGILGWDNHDGWGDPPVFDPDIIANGDTEEFANHGLKSAADGGLL